MPTRVIVWIVVALALIAGGVFLLMPSDDAGSDAAAGGTEFPGDPAGATTPIATATPVPAASQATPAELAGDVQAFAAARTPVIPPTQGLGTLATVTAQEGTVTFVFDVAIDGTTFDIENERTELTPGLAAIACDDGTCFEVEASVVEAACADPELAELLRRGATAAYLYRDTAGRELGAISITAANCPV